MGAVLLLAACSKWLYETDLYSEALPSAQLNEYYSHTLDYKDHQNNVAFKVTEGVLPTGITLSRTGQLVGTPTEAGSSHFSVTLYEDFTDGGVVNLDCFLADEDDGCTTEEEETDTYSNSDLETDTEWFVLEVVGE